MTDLAKPKGARFRSISTKLMLMQSMAFVAMIGICIAGELGINSILTRMTSIYNDRVIPLVQIKTVSDAYIYELARTGEGFATGGICRKRGQQDAHCRLDRNGDPAMGSLPCDLPDRGGEGQDRRRRSGASCGTDCGHPGSRRWSMPGTLAALETFTAFPSSAR